MPHTLNDWQKFSRLEIYFFLLLRSKNEPFLIELLFVMKSEISSAVTQQSDPYMIDLLFVRKSGICTKIGVVLDSGLAPQAFPKVRNISKKDMVTVWWSAAGIIQYNFFNRRFSNLYC